MARSARSRRLAVIGTVLAVLLGAFFLAIPLMSGMIARFLPRSIEEAIGKQLVDTLAENPAFCTGKEGIAALDVLVDRLAANADTDYTFKVFVIDAPILNAFAAPGGHIVIYRAIIEEAERPEEVAGVLAHEMAHVIERHPAEGVVEALGYGVFSLFTPGGGVGSQITQAVVTNHYSRQDELDADRVGVETLNAAGIDSRGLGLFFERLEARGQELPGALEFLSTHPTGDTRKKALAGLAREGGPALDPTQWAALRSVCDTHGDPTPAGG